MKKISRRAFMGAIGAVMAASMLAGCGCNYQDKTDVTDMTYQPQTKTVVFEDDKAFTVNSVGYGTTHDGFIQVDFTMVNNLDETVKIVDEYEEEPDDLNIKVTTYFDGNYTPVAPVDSGEDNLIDKTLKAHSEKDGVVSEYSLNGSIYFVEPEEWKTMTVVFTVTVDEDTQEIQFTYSK